MLYSVFSLTILLRFVHKYDWPIWGSDSGEYLYLTRYLVENGMMLNEDYIGWGRAYPDFQGMQILTATIALVFDVSYYTSLTWFIPLISGLAIPILFIIGKELAGFTPALFGSAFYGVTFGVGLASTVKQSRQLIIHGHISVEGAVNRVPGMLVTKTQEKNITYSPSSALNSDLHPVRPGVKETYEDEEPEDEKAAEEVAETEKPTEEVTEDVKVKEEAK